MESGVIATMALSAVGPAIRGTLRARHQSQNVVAAVAVVIAVAIRSEMAVADVKHAVIQAGMVVTNARCV